MFEPSQLEAHLKPLPPLEGDRINRERKAAGQKGSFVLPDLKATVAHFFDGFGLEAAGRFKVLPMVKLQPRHSAEVFD